MAKTPYLDAVRLAEILADGGYLQTVQMTQATNLLLLSALHVIRMRWLWQSAIQPISDTLWVTIQDYIEEAEAQLMSNFLVGSIFASVAIMNESNILLLAGQTILQADYPELAAVVPPTWLAGSDIQLPDMRDTFMQGAANAGELGAIQGENEVTLTVAEMPAHSHVQNPHWHSYSTVFDTPLVAAPGPEPVSFVLPSVSNTASVVATNQNTGGDSAHNNVPLALQVAWYIVAR